MDSLYPLDALCLSCDVDPAPSVTSPNCYISVNHLHRKREPCECTGVGSNVNGGDIWAQGACCAVHHRLGQYMLVVLYTRNSVSSVQLLRQCGVVWCGVVCGNTPANKTQQYRGKTCRHIHVRCTHTTHTCAHTKPRVKA